MAEEGGLSVLHVPRLCQFSVQEYLVWFEDWNNQAKNTREDDNIRQINVRVRHTRSGSRVLRSTAAISVSRSGGQCKQIYTTENENYTTS